MEMLNRGTKDSSDLQSVVNFYEETNISRDTKVVFHYCQSKY